MNATPSVSAGRPRATTSLLALHGLLLRTQLTAARILGVAALGTLAVLLGVLSRADDDPTDAAADVVATYGLGLLVPLATLWLGTSVVGDLVEDRLLVYLWLKPVARWQLPAAATLATVSVIVPLTALPLAASTLAAGAGGDLVLATLAASVLATAAYTGLFVAAGLWFRRAAWWGLAFVVFWENVVALSAEGLARFTVSEWARTILETAPGVDVAVGARSPTAAFVVLPAVALAGWLLATVRYGRADVD
jgi:ABC-2 type transport system permease protein